MQKYSFFLGLAPILALSACGGADSGSNTSSDMTNAGIATDAMTPANGEDDNLAATEAASPDKVFADRVAASDAYEIEAGKLAQQKATAAGLKDFGRMMVEQHTQSTDKLKAAAAKAQPTITPDPVLTPEQQGNLEALRSAEGAAFDTLYKQQQVAAHEQALGLLRDYAATGDSTPLKTFAAEAQKVVQMHITKLRAM